MTKAPNKGGDPRRVALAVLRTVLRQRRHLDAAIEGNQAWQSLETRDRAFARLLVGALLRHLGTLDSVIAHCLERPLKERDGDLKDLLRLGAVQLLQLGTPAHAAISTTMKLAERTPRLKGQKRLLNGVLARLSREGETLLAEIDSPRLNSPDWLYQRWQKTYGETTAQAIAVANQREAPLDITVKGDRAAVQSAFAAAGIDAAPLFRRSLRLTGVKGDPTALPGFDAGAWWVQDAAAALTCDLLYLEPGQTVVDLCAAPGGKTAGLAAGGAQVIAVERAAGRIARLRANLKRLGLTARVVEADATTWRPDSPVSTLLLDAPCSGTGTLRRHPDIARLRRESELADLTALQDRLLDAAAEMLAPEGRLLYVVCSLEAEEGPERIAALLARRGDLVRSPVDRLELDGEDAFITAEGDLRTLPCHLPDQGGLDGFYACRLVKH